MLITALFSSALMFSPAAAPPVSRQQVHSVEADYVRTVTPDGTVTLQGQDRSGTLFHYTVKDGVVRGWVGNRSVHFPLPEANAERSRAE
jgi:hypothetical protein